jgi:hypothetical protein
MATAAELVIREETALARLDPQSLISQAIEKGAGIETLERLVALAERVQKITAKQAYDAAMAEFQRDCPPIFKTREARIATRTGGGYKYTFAPLDEITAVISPHMGKVGLSFRWRVPSPEEWKSDGDKIAQICRITHAAGHYEESGVVTMPVERAVEGGSGANPMQRVGIALTYAKRYSLLTAIGRAPEDDDQDGAGGGGEQREQDSRAGDPHAPVQDGDPRVISEGQGKRLWAIAREHGWSQEEIKDLLTSYGVEHTNELPLPQYDGLIAKLKARAKK